MIYWVNANSKKKSSLLQCPEKSKDLISQLPDDENSNDLISQLSDDILISIVARLPTKDAVKTSVLSRRWRNLYRFSPVYKIELGCPYLLKHGLVNILGLRMGAPSQRWSLYRIVCNMQLVFGDALIQKKTHNSKAMMLALDRYLRLHSGYNILSFRLDCCLNKSVTAPFEQCISYLGRLGVEELFLKCCCFTYRYSSDYSFSCDLLSKMPSLKYFELSKCFLQPSLMTSQCNNSLQTIVLSYVTLNPGSLECVLSNCLRLRSFTITSCKCPPKLRFCGPHLELKSLYINVCDGLKELELYASNLLVFEVSCVKLFDIRFDHVPQLQNVRLFIHSRDTVRYVCGRLPLDLPHLESLSFITCGRFDGFIQINRFNNLRRLHISMKQLPKLDLRSLTSILQRCPLLQEFLLNVDSRGDEEQVEKQDVVSHWGLKKVEISGFNGTEYEMEIALYILKSAINLERMQISKCARQCREPLKEPDSWYIIPATPWSEDVEAMIHTKLQGQAVSEIAQLVIQHKGHLNS